MPVWLISSTSTEIVWAMGFQLAFSPSDQRDGDVGELENGEGEQVTDLLRRGGMDVVPFGKGSKHAEDEHEQHEVKQAEEHRR